jgi:hypothetical protein
VRERTIDPRDLSPNEDTVGLAAHEPLDGCDLKIEFYLYMRRLAENCAQKTKKAQYPNGWHQPCPVPKKEDRDRFSLLGSSNWMESPRNGTLEVA